MGEEDFVMSQLRGQVQRFNSVMTYLESRPAVGAEEYAYMRTTLHDMIGRLKELERFASERGQAHQTRTQWVQAN